MSGARVLLVDDDPGILRAVARALVAADYRVETLATGSPIPDTVRRFRPEVILLDLVLPDSDGVDVCRDLRTFDSTPIIVLSAVGDDRRKVEALDAGADDYVTKPFSMPELLARIRVALRRRANTARESALQAGPLTLDVVSHRVTVGSTPVHLTPREFDLLLLLLRQPGRVLTQRLLLTTVWGPEYAGESHILRTFIHQIRAKLAAVDRAAADLIVTDPGVGYRLEPPP